MLLLNDLEAGATPSVRATRPTAAATSSRSPSSAGSSSRASERARETVEDEVLKALDSSERAALRRLLVKARGGLALGQSILRRDRDVFTATPLEGNPVAVFTDAAGLSPELMQRTARELNLSETVFVVAAAAPTAWTPTIRIFTPSPSCLRRPPGARHGIRARVGRAPTRSAPRPAPGRFRWRSTRTEGASCLAR